MALIVFDLDGTLIDSAPDIQAIANRILEVERCEILDLKDTRNFIGNGASVFVQKMCDYRGIPTTEHQRVLKTFVDLYETAVDLTEPYAGVSDALAVLREEGHHLGICTNKPIKPTHAVLKHLGLSDYFDTVWGGDSLTVRKPDPAPLISAFDALDDSHGDLRGDSLGDLRGDDRKIYVGDSEVDSETAQNAKVPFVLFTEGYRKKPIQEVPHSVQFSSYSNLPGIIQNIV